MDWHPYSTLRWTFAITVPWDELAPLQYTEMDWQLIHGDLFQVNFGIGSGLQLLCRNEYSRLLLSSFYSLLQFLIKMLFPKVSCVYQEIGLYRDYHR